MSALHDDQPQFEIVHQSDPGPVTWAPVMVEGMLHGALWTNSTRAGWLSAPTDGKAADAAVAATGKLWTDRLAIARDKGRPDWSAFLTYWTDQSHPGATEVGAPRQAPTLEAVLEALAD